MSHRPPNPPRKSTFARSTRTTKTNTSARHSHSHNLAGPNANSSHPNLPHSDAHNTYYAEGYRSLNPMMENSEPKPDFSLARNFPHKVRWGGGKKPPAKNRDSKIVEKAGVETAPWKRRRDVDQTSGNGDREDVEWDEESCEGPEWERPFDFDDAGYEDERNGEYVESVAEEDGEDDDRPFNTWAHMRLRLQRPLAEWLGTTILTFIGKSGTLAVQISFATAKGSKLPLQTQSQNWTWGFATMLAIYISGGGSGALLSPVLTILLSVFRGFPAKRVPIYILSQVLGAFTGALLAYVVYRDGIAMIPDGKKETATAFYTQPQDWMSNGTAFITEMLGTAVIGICILALGDSGNSPPGAGMHAFVIGLMVVAVTMALGQGTGGCFNPATDLGPRLAAAVVGYDMEMWTARKWWWAWGAWGATMTGMLLGGFVYDVCVFKGGESPVNYSWRRWRAEGLREEKLWTERLGMGKKTDDLQKQLEEGGLDKE